MSNPGTATVASPINLTTAAASVVLSSRLVQADAQPAFQVLGDGTLKWGVGGGTAPDVSLKRSLGGIRIDPSLLVGTSSTPGVVNLPAGVNAIYFGGPFLGTADGGTSLTCTTPFNAANGINTAVIGNSGGSNIVAKAAAAQIFLQSGDGNNIITIGSTAKIAFFGGAAVAQPAHPVTLADVIAALTALGLTA